MTTPHTTRRSLLAATGTATAGLLAGCIEALSDDGGASSDGASDDGASGSYADADLPTVENPPDVVYTPSHREGVEMLEPVQVGEYVLGAMVSYAHPFWTITGDRVEPVEVHSGEDVHLMATVWDAETETVLPTDEGVTMRLYRDGELLDERTPWSMLSQSMGFHFGDNFPLDGDGTYELEIELPPPDVRTTGAFDGRFESFETASLEFTYDQEVHQELLDGIEYFDESVWGEPGAIEPGHGHDHDGHDDGMDGDGHEDDSHADGMNGDGHDEHDDELDGDGHDEHDGEMDGHHDMPVTVVPEASALPGTLQHDADELPRSHDADVAVTVVDDFHGRSPYLLVSPRTPYNRIPLPAMSLSVTVEREGSEVVTAEPVPSLDPQAGFHYGVEVPELESGDDVTVRFESPPQVARHQGYETAFVDLTSIELSVEGW